MNCNDETTVLEQRGPDGISESTTSLRSDETNLYKQIDKDHIFGLNLSSPDQGSICIKPWDKRDEVATWTESGVDDQFIITIPFVTQVKIKSILLNPGRGDFAPQRIRAYVNRQNGVGFEEVEATSAMGGGPGAGVGTIASGKPQADFLLQEGTAGVTEYPVSISRFQNVHTVTLVISDAPSRSLSRLYYLGFRGTAPQINKEESNRFEVGAANSADKPVDGIGESRRNYGGIGYGNDEGAR
ncbi:hypothetical protein CBS101457_003867 [Exobasidium rhododendri]|nr:hypothetical protein CBS101457_003867 [Exobasidium rhododendri]